ncbi:MAG: hypothetical protein KGS45_09885 [Planctomycetes bacterium]|nr:hypothetical protein [Planctomycetota bacterium]
MTRSSRVATTLCLTIASLAQADVVYSDGTFTPSNWGLETFTANGAGGSVTAAQLSSGGNPGQARSVTNTTGTGPDQTIFGLHRYGTTNATRYEPLNQGAIASVDFSIDFAFRSGVGGQGHGLALGAKQGTVIYAAAATVTGSSTAWNTYSVTGLSAADFTAVSGTGAINFSASGAPIRFGFITSNSNGSSGTSYFNEIAYDNFLVRVNQVPAPTWTSVVCGTLITTACRRRRSR